MFDTEDIAAVSRHPMHVVNCLKSVRILRPYITDYKTDDQAPLTEPDRENLCRIGRKVF
jgi:hypothetical protein